MIVVIGSMALEGDGQDAVPAGPAARLATAAAADGGTVEVITKVGDDPAGDAVLLGLTRRGIGHAAVLRDAVHRTVVHAAPPGSDDPAVPTEEEGIDAAGASDAAVVASDTAGASDAAIPVSPIGPVLEAADVGLALRYLTDFRVIVTVHATAAVVTVAAEAAEWAAAHLLVVSRRGDVLPDVLPASTVVVEAVDPDDGGSALPLRLGTFAARLDREADPRLALAELTATGGID